jgi:hypothetical protein
MPSRAQISVLVLALAVTGCADEETSDGFPHGAFRADVTESVLLDAGVDDESAYRHAGIWTMTLRDGEVVVSDVNAATGRTTTEVFVACVDGETMALGFTECGDFWTAQWVLESDTIRFLDVEAGSTQVGAHLLLSTIFGSTPFVQAE